VEFGRPRSFITRQAVRRHCLTDQRRVFAPGVAWRRANLPKERNGRVAVPRGRPNDAPQLAPTRPAQRRALAVDALCSG
jgi:hypothetical protein